MSDQRMFKRGSMSYGYVGKVVFIIVLVLVFLIPLSMIRHIVMERQARSQEAEQEIMDLWGGRQTIAGPCISVPFRKIITIETEKGERTEEVMSWFYITPASLDIRAEMITEMRTRGIYRIPVYRTSVTLSGEFTTPDIGGLRLANEDIYWEDAKLAIELPDMRSVGTGTRLVWNGDSGEFVSNVGTLGIFSNNLEYGLDVGWQKRKSNDFSIDLNLRGAGSLSFLPFGDETKVSLVSDWPSPSFEGAFLPAERELSEESGFTASWSVHSLARSFPCTWMRGDLDNWAISGSSFGVSLFEPVGLYTRVERSVKYAMMFIILPFVAFFMMEVFSRKRIHILQYLMVGAANTIFYLLVLSLSEHLGFNIAYVLGAGATTALIIFYSAAILPGTKAGFAMAPVMTGLYIFLYTALQSEDYALLIGSLGLFAMLTLVMIITRKIDWYSLNRRRSEERGEDKG